MRTLPATQVAQLAQLPILEVLPRRTASTRPPIAIMGVPFDNLSISEAMAAIETMVASGQPHYLVTANVDFLVQAQHDHELRRILCDAHLVLCDGTPLVWASRLLGNPLPERVAGADLVPLLLRVAAEKKYRVFFLGATHESCTRAVSRLRKQYPELIIAGHYSPPFSSLLEMDHEEIRKRILAAKPDLLFVAFGCPKAEKWMAMNYRTLGVPVAAGIGATIDFLAGQVKRAPRWMQRSGTEWLFRLSQEPRRLFRRYMKDLWVFSWNILAQWRQVGRFHPEPRPLPTNVLTLDPFTGLKMRQDGLPSRSLSMRQYQVIKMPRQLDFAAVQEQGWLAADTLCDGDDVLVEMSDVKSIDSTGIGLLIRIQKQARAAGRQMILVAPSQSAQRALGRLHLHDFFNSAPNMAAARQAIGDRRREQFVLVAPGTPEPLETGALVCRGEITAANAEKIWECMHAYLMRSRSGEVWRIDLSQVRFIDSSGLGLMVRAKKLANSHAASLVFTGLTPAVRNVVHLARLGRWLLEESIHSGA